MIFRDYEAPPSTSQPAGKNITKGTKDSNLPTLPTFKYVNRKSPLSFSWPLRFSLKVGKCHFRAHVQDLLRKYKNHLIEKHDALLIEFFNGQPFEKLYSFHTIINGFAVRLTAEQVVPVSFVVYANCERKQLTSPMSLAPQFAFLIEFYSKRILCLSFIW